VEEKQCILCEGYFRVGAMEGDKCNLCAGLYPNAKTKDDIKVKTKNEAKTLSDETVREIVYEILEEANLKRVKCDKCGKLYFRTSPAQKNCPDCRKMEKK